MKEYKGRVLSNFSNPYSKTYFATNLVLFTGCFYTKYLQIKYRQPGGFVSTLAILGLIWVSISDRKKIDFSQGYMFESLQ